jgi:long-chain-acyl-CoA dehydrogenase
MSIAYYALAAAEAALRWTVDHVKNRRAFGQTIAQFQSTKFTLAEIVTELDVTRAYLERCVDELTAATRPTWPGQRTNPAR